MSSLNILSVSNESGDRQFVAPTSSRAAELDLCVGRVARKVYNMPLIQLVEVLIVVGVLLWLVNRYIPMQGTIKSILNAVVVIAVVLWILNISGLFHSVSGIRIGKG